VDTSTERALVLFDRLILIFDDSARDDHVFCLIAWFTSPDIPLFI